MEFLFVIIVPKYLNCSADSSSGGGRGRGGGGGDVMQRIFQQNTSFHVSPGGLNFVSRLKLAPK
jgi:hypothetical protein